MAYSKTGVANYLENLLDHLLKNDQNTYVLFFSTLRGGLPDKISEYKKLANVEVKILKIPPTALDFMWNKLHIRPIEGFVGDVDWFITSDWTEPPTKKAKKATIIYDMIVYKYPDETHAKIRNTQKRKLKWVKKESNIIFTISRSSKKDISEILKIDESKIKVITPGIN